MATIWVRKIDGGLDARRLPETTAGGALIKAEDGHLNRGGEFEKRAAFVPEYTLPTGTTKGLAAKATGLYVFSTSASPGTMPSGVTHLKLEPSVTYLGQALAKVRSWDLFGSNLYVVGELQTGVEHYYEGVVEGITPPAGSAYPVTTSVSSQASYSFQVTSGTGASTINITIDGVAIMSGAVTWGTSNSATAAAIASEINSNASTPEYSAGASDNTVIISAASGGASSNGRVVAFTLVSGFVVTPITPDYALAGGIDGTFPELDAFVRTVESRMLAAAGSTVVASGIEQPTEWGSGVVGAGFIDMAQKTSGTGDIVAFAEYQNLIAIFTPKIILLWSIPADLADALPHQVLRNTGTSYSRSVTQFGDADIFYLDESGLRSLRARDSSNSAATTGVGIRVDPLIVAKLATMTTAERQNITGLVEPRSGRFWLIMKDTIFVFSYFPDEKIGGWTKYNCTYFVNDVETTFNVTDAVVFDNRVYLRAGDTIFAYGGIDSGDETDATVAEAWLAYLDGDDPAKVKNWTGFDAAVSGEWAVAAAMSLADTSVEDDVANIDRTTYNHDGIDGVGVSTHISLRFRSRGDGPAVLSACAVHYASDEDGK